MKPLLNVMNDNTFRQPVMVAENQPEYRTLPSLYKQDNKINVTRWGCDDEFEREVLEKEKCIYLYVLKIHGEHAPFLLSTSPNTDELVTDIHNFSGVKIRRTTTHSLFYSIPQINHNNERHNCYLWELNNHELRFIKDNEYSFWVYQFSMGNLITPFLVSLFENQPIS